MGPSGSPFHFSFPTLELGLIWLLLAQVILLVLSYDVVKLIFIFLISTLRDTLKNYRSRTMAGSWFLILSYHLLYSRATFKSFPYRKQSMIHHDTLGRWISLKALPSDCAMWPFIFCGSFHILEGCTLVAIFSSCR